MANGPVWGLCLLGLKGEPAPIDTDIETAPRRWRICQPGHDDSAENGMQASCRQPMMPQYTSALSAGLRVRVSIKVGIGLNGK